MKLIFSEGPSQNTRLVVAVVLSLGLMLVDHRYQHLDRLRSALAYVTYPLQLLADLPVSASRWLGTTVSSHSDLLTENERLREENLTLQARLQQYAQLRKENLRLRDLLESSYKVGDRVLVAELKSVDLDPFKQLVIIDKGTSSGVYPGQPVLDANAVMGQVVHVNRFAAEVLLITDVSHALPVQVVRNGLRTTALGTGRIDLLDLPHLTNNADIRVGDKLVTSGLGGKFPPGYPVASITGVTRQPGQPFASVRATPLAHLDRTREVLLVWTIDNPTDVLLPAGTFAETTVEDPGADDPASAATDPPAADRVQAADTGPGTETLEGTADPTTATSPDGIPADGDQ